MPILHIRIPITSTVDKYLLFTGLSGTLFGIIGITSKDSHFMEDNFLIEQAKAGNPHAFRLLVLRYQRPLFKFLSGFAIPLARVEELAQDTLLRVHENLSSYQAEKGASFVTWLFVIAKRLALNELARSEHRFQTEEINDAIDVGRSGCWT